MVFSLPRSSCSLNAHNALVSGPKYILPSLDPGPAYTLGARPAGFSDDTSATSMDLNGGGPGVCRYDSAFGKQIVSYQATQPSASFESRDSNPKLAPVLNMKAITGGDYTHDWLTEDTRVRCGGLWLTVLWCAVVWYAVVCGGGTRSAVVSSVV